MSGSLLCECGDPHQIKTEFEYAQVGMSGTITWFRPKSPSRRAVEVWSHPDEQLSRGWTCSRGQDGRIVFSGVYLGSDPVPGGVVGDAGHLAKGRRVTEQVLACKCSCLRNMFYLRILVCLVIYDSG